MSLSVEKAQVSDVAAAKFELAERLVNDVSALPKQVLEPIFKGAMQALEKIVEKQFDASLKERVWNKVSKKQLESLQEYFLLKFCKKILGIFDANETEKMLEEHKRTGSISRFTYAGKLRISYQFHHKNIIDSVIRKAHSMTDNWVPEIVKAIREEGVELPNSWENIIDKTLYAKKQAVIKFT